MVSPLVFAIKISQVWIANEIKNRKAIAEKIPNKTKRIMTDLWTQKCKNPEMHEARQPKNPGIQEIQ